jgi:hypothetical protein
MVTDNKVKEYIIHEHFKADACTQDFKKKKELK